MKINTEQAKYYFWYIFGVMGIVFFWAGVWDGIGSLPFIKNPLISFILGLLILTLSGIVFKEFDPLKEAEKTITNIMEEIHNHEQKQEFHIKYNDKIKQKEIIYPANSLKKIEKGFLVLIDQEKKEIFIPLHRITEVLRNGQTYKKISIKEAAE